MTAHPKLLDVAAIIFDEMCGMTDGTLSQKDAIDVAAKAIHSLRDPPHALLDMARGGRMASGDALVFWNFMIDELAHDPSDPNVPEHRRLRAVPKE